MEIVIVLIVGVVSTYLYVNSKRNSDPMNRKCAAEICEYLVSTDRPDPLFVRDIFVQNARDHKQANHIVSMVPQLLVNAGIPRQAALSIVSALRQAADSIPR